MRERAAESCEYCLIPESITLATHAIDHIVAEKHGGHTAADNLALSCTICNGHKGSDLASVDPETAPSCHFFIRAATAGATIFTCLVLDSNRGPLPVRVTVRLLQLNHPIVLKSGGCLSQQASFRFLR